MKLKLGLEKLKRKESFFLFGRRKVRREVKLAVGLSFIVCSRKNWPAGEDGERLSKGSCPVFTATQDRHHTQSRDERGSIWDLRQLWETPLLVSP